MKLTNGATVLRAAINYEGETATAVVLATWNAHEFVTWDAYLRPGETEWDAEVGHYFNAHEPFSEATIAAAKDAAIGDFRARIGAR
jgi:hypothetical protein